MSLLWTTPEGLSAAFGVCMAVLFMYLPALNTWYAAKAEAEKQQIMAILLTIFALAGGVLSCTGLIPLYACTKPGILDFLINVFLPSLMLSVGLNQSLKLILPVPKAVKAAKLAGKKLRGEIV